MVDYLGKLRTLGLIPLVLGLEPARDGHLAPEL